jgi:hypothetical protein
MKKPISSFTLHSAIRLRILQEFRDKYFLADWMGVRPKLAHRGLRLALLSINDPYGNTTGGRQRLLGYIAGSSTNRLVSEFYRHD